MTPPQVIPCYLAVSLPAWNDRPLTPLAQWCMRWTPRVHIELEHGPPALVLDLTGCLPANGGAVRVVRRVRRAFVRRGIECCLGMASTAGGAIALSGVEETARQHPVTPTQHAMPPQLHAATPPLRVATPPLRVAPPGNPWPALDPLPLTTLRLPSATLQGLLEVNVCTIGNLRAIDRHAVADRYGPQPTERLDTLVSAGGRAWPFHPVAPPQRIMGEFIFASPCAQLQAVEQAMRHAVADLCQHLDQRMRGVCTLEVRVDRARMPPVRGRMYFGAPTRNPAHLWTLLAPRVERMQLGCYEHGMGIERIRLVALRLGSAQCDATRQAVGQLVDQLCARLGSGAVQCAAPDASAASKATPANVRAATATAGSA